MKNVKDELLPVRAQLRIVDADHLSMEELDRIKEWLRETAGWLGAAHPLARGFKATLYRAEAQANVVRQKKPRGKKAVKRG